MRLSLIVAPPCGSDSSQAPVQRSLILTPNKYRKSGVRPSGLRGWSCNLCELQGANTKSNKTESTKKKQHTQHRMFISGHPLPFRSIAVCIGVRTAILHRCSHLAFISPAGIGARTLPFTVRWSYRLALFRVVFNCPTSLHHARPSCRHHRDGRNGKGIVGGIDT